ncbi:VOC family protein [Sanguibacter suaedae]|uniref:VOC family protein n=1 Tax=Sanguibacter suaedae TaxID=2795737 RepID=UPI001E427A8F|nr:VOC family protein [Sanguibacter suaedae]
MGYRENDTWDGGCSWRRGETYIVLEAGPDVRGEEHDRRRPGLNHLAFHGGTANQVEALAREAQGHGWSVLFADRHPHAGGPLHYAAYLENGDGFEVELVASA